MKKSKGHL